MTFAQVLGGYALGGIVTTLGFLLYIRHLAKTKRAEEPGRLSTRLDSRDAAGGQRLASQFYQPGVILPTTAESLCGRCGYPAHAVGMLSSAGFCEACTPVPVQICDLSDMEIAVRRMA